MLFRSKTTSFGNITGKISKGEGSGSTNINISSLQSFTKYYFRAIASDGIDTKIGEIENFTTPIKITIPHITIISPTVSTITPSNVTESSAVLNGTVNPNGSSTTAYFEYGTSQSNLAYTVGTQSIGSGISSVSVSYTLSGLNPDRKSTRLNSSHTDISRMPSSA